MKKILLLLIISGLMLLSSACSKTAAAETTAGTTSETKPYIEAYGIVKATDVKNITLEFQAPVTKIHVREGQKVKSGQLLVSLDMSEALSQLNNKKLELKAVLNDRDSSASSADLDLKKLENDLASVRGIYNKDLVGLNSNQLLFNKGNIPLSELEASKKLVAADKKAVDDVLFSIESMKNNKGTLKKQKNTQADELNSEIKLLENQLKEPYIKGSDIVSDIDNGLVYDIGYIVGDIANSQKKLLSILDLNTLVVEANIPEEFVKDVKLGAPVTIVPAADKSKKYKGCVIYLSGKAFGNNGETTVPVTISIENRDDFLLPDYNVDIQIDAASK